MTEQRTLNFRDLPDLRKKTIIVSECLQSKLRGYLDTLRPLLGPERILGKGSGDSGGVTWTAKTLSEIEKRYREVARPFGVTHEFDTEWLSEINSRLEIFPFEYVREAKTATEAPRRITMTSPVRWIVTYGSTYTLPRLKHVLEGKERQQPELVRQFILHVIVLQLVIAANPGLTDLFHALRFNIETMRIPEMHSLPLLTFVSHIPAFAPSDDLVIAATEFSGVPAFVEIIDTEALPTVRDPIVIELQRLLEPAAGRAVAE